MLYFSRQSTSPLLHIVDPKERSRGKKLIIGDFKNIRLYIISPIFESTPPATVLRIVRINITARSVACASKNNSFVNLLAVDHCQLAGVSAFPSPPGPWARTISRINAVSGRDTGAGNGTRRPQEIDR